MSEFTLCELDLFPRESMAKKKEKESGRGDGVQPGFIRIGLGHILGFGSRNILSGLQHKAPQISWHVTALQTDID